MGNGCREIIAAPVNRFDDAVFTVTKGLPDLLDALDQGIVRAGYTIPNGLEQFFLGDETARVLRQVAEDVKGLRAELQLLSVPEEGWE